VTRFSCLGLFTLLVCCYTKVSFSQEIPREPILPRVAGIFVKPVSGAPFSATVEFVSRQKLPDGSVFVLKTMNHIARDAAGRTHNESRKFVAESYKGEPLLSDIHIYDPQTGLDTHLDPLTLIARQMRKTEPPEPNAQSVPDPNPKVLASPVKQVKGLGTRNFQGVTLQGTRQSGEDGNFNEYWYSPEFSIFMSRRHKNAAWDQTVEIIDFHAQEPDASDFVIPADYKVVEVKETLPVPDTSGVYRVGNGVLTPELIYAPEPQYTAEARSKKYSGTAVVSLIVDVHGNPQNIQILRHLEMGLDEASVAAVSKYKFKPGTLKGNPVPVLVRLEVKFRIY
jgi:TonB family protein